MFANVLQKFGQFLRHFLPTATVFLFILVSVLVWPLPFVAPVAPALGLVAVYYWAIYRPDILRPLGIFILGLLNDIVHFLPLGVSAFVFVGAYQLALSQRRFFVGQTFYMLWSGFALVGFLAMVVNWIVLSVVNGDFVALFPVFMQFLLTAALFPVPAWMLIRLQRGFLSQG